MHWQVSIQRLPLKKKFYYIKKKWKLRDAIQYKLESI